VTISLDWRLTIGRGVGATRSCGLAVFERECPGRKKRDLAMTRIWRENRSARMSTGGAVLPMQVWDAVRPHPTPGRYA
jgi:hypothetical protein